MAAALERERQRLYGLPRSTFTAARNARAKELKGSDPALAAAVAALPKPSVAAAALNALVREDPSEVRALIQSGKRLRQAQEAAVSGTKGADLNEAVQEHRTGLERVQRELRARTVSGPTLEKATQTLRAVSVDPELQGLLERGTLTEDVTASGFGIDPGLVRARTPAAKPKAATKPKAAALPKAAAQPKAAAKPKTAAKRDRSAEEKRRRAAEQRLREAEAAFEKAEARARAAQRDLERATEAVEQARRAV